MDAGDVQQSGHPVVAGRRRTIIQDRQREAKAKPGQCPKCGKHVGRGIAMHRKVCNG